MRERSPVRYGPHDVVADALMSAFWRQVSWGVTEAFEKRGADRQAPYCEFERWSLRNCRPASAYTLYNIAHHPKGQELFDRFVLLTSWPYHSYFLVRDRGHVWHLGSPANYWPGKIDALRGRDKETFRIVSGNLSTLTDYLHAAPLARHGRWPTKGEIRALSRNSSRLLPRLERAQETPDAGILTVFEIAWEQRRTVCVPKQEIPFDFRQRKELPL